MSEFAWWLSGALCMWVFMKPVRDQAKVGRDSMSQLVQNQRARESY